MHPWTPALSRHAPAAPDVPVSHFAASAHPPATRKLGPLRTSPTSETGGAEGGGRARPGRALLRCDTHITNNS